jgi:hypothetical protein
MHQNASHIYVGGSKPWCGWHGRGGGEPSAAESGGRGSRCRAAAAKEEEAGIEATMEETGIERRQRRQRRPV